jgi:hypothetical protein
MLTNSNCLIQAYYVLSRMPISNTRRLIIRNTFKRTYNRNDDIYQLLYKTQDVLGQYVLKEDELEEGELEEDELEEDELEEGEKGKQNISIQHDVYYNKVYLDILNNMIAYTNKLVSR